MHCEMLYVFKRYHQCVLGGIIQRIVGNTAECNSYQTPQVGFPVENLELVGALLPEIMMHVGPLLDLARF